ncbi:MAG: hypothetical protein LBM27_02765 [Lactobacillaceae bacterium]|jgi:hypothetical protein|nr:hypothetical protein [Lactobacillaceae bacterium]
MFYRLEEVGNDLKIVDHETIGDDPYLMMAISRKIAKKIGLKHDELPELPENADQQNIYYATTKDLNHGLNYDFAVLARHALDNTPELYISFDWDEFLETNPGEFGVTLLAQFSDWMYDDHEEVDPDSNLPREKFMEQDEWAWKYYQAPRQITTEMIEADQELEAKLIAAIKEIQGE